MIDYKRFIQERFRIVNKDGKVVPFQLNAIQAKYLDEDMTGRDALLKARQQGLSSLILAIFTTDFIGIENSRSMVIADIEDNASELLDRVKFYIQSYEEITGKKIPLKYNSKYELFNEAMNSRYTIGTAKNSDIGRSKTITNLHLSEFAYYPDPEKLFAGIMQAVVPNGKVIIETTANGFNYFRDFWTRSKDGKTGFTAHFYPASHFYTQEFLAKKEAELGRYFKQEYPETDMNAFQHSGDCFFNTESLSFYLSNVKDAQQLSDSHEFRQYREFRKGEFIVVFADSSAGLGDYSACQFLSKSNLDVPLVYHSSRLATEMTNELYPILQTIYETTGIKPVVAYERNNGGLFELERLASLNRNNAYEIFHMPTFGNIENPSPVKIGWETSSSTRPKMLSDIKEAVDKRLIRLYDRKTIEELYSFILVQTTTTIRAQAERRAHDDLVMSLAGAWQLYQLCNEPFPADMSYERQNFDQWKIGD